jgi:hypothetical protein
MKVSAIVRPTVIVYSVTETEKTTNECHEGPSRRVLAVKEPCFNSTNAVCYSAFWELRVELDKRSEAGTRSTRLYGKVIRLTEVLAISSEKACSPQVTV